MEQWSSGRVKLVYLRSGYLKTIQELFDLIAI